MIFVDRRRGSAELIDLIEQRGLKTQKTTLPFGDFSFFGNGPDGQVFIGVERKRLGEIVSSMRGDARFAGRQAQGMTDLYKFRWLIVEGRWYVSKGDIVVPWGKKRKVVCEASRFLRYLVTLEMLSFHVRFTATMVETVEHLVGVYWWWQKAWDQHDSYLAVYHAASKDESWSFLQAAEPDALTAIYQDIDGIGGKMARQLRRLYPNLESFVEAVKSGSLKDVRGIGPSILAECRRLVDGSIKQ